MGISTNGIVSLVVEGTVLEQRMLTVLHLRRITATNGATTVTADLADILFEMQPVAGGQDWLQTLYLACCANNFTLDRFVAQQIFPTRSVKVTRTVGLAGTVGSPCEIPNVSGVLTKRTVLAGRNQVGSIHMPAVATAEMDNGVLEAAQLVRYANLSASLLTNVVHAAPDAEYDLVIHHPQFPGTFNKVNDILTQDTVRTMRRRTLRLGV